MEQFKEKEIGELSPSGVCPHCGNSDPALLFQYTPTWSQLADSLEGIWGCLRCGAEWEESYPRPLHCKKQIITEGKEIF